MGVSIFEQETTINMMRDEDKAYVWTSDTLMIRKLDKKCAEEGSAWKCVRTDYIQGTKDVACKEYAVDKRMISFRTRPANKRELTEEEKERLRIRMQKMQELRRRQLEGNIDDAEADRLEAELDDMEEQEDES